jgi:hypothetical protein
LRDSDSFFANRTESDGEQSCDRDELPAEVLVIPGQKREARLRADVPGIHALAASAQEKTWMAGTSPAMTEEATRANIMQTRC